MVALPRWLPTTVAEGDGAERPVVNRQVVEASEAASESGADELQAAAWEDSPRGWRENRSGRQACPSSSTVPWVSAAVALWSHQCLEVALASVGLAAEATAPRG